MTSKPDQCSSKTNLEWKLPQANGFNAWEDANSSSPWLKNIDHCCLIQGLHKLWAQYTTTILPEIPWKNCLTNSNNKEQLLIYIFFSKSGLVGQHKYLTPIVSTSFSLSSIYKHNLTFLIICEQHGIDNYVHLPTFFIVDGCVPNNTNYTTT